MARVSSVNLSLHLQVRHPRLRASSLYRAAKRTGGPLKFLNDSTLIINIHWLFYLRSIWNYSEPSEGFVENFFLEAQYIISDSSLHFNTSGKESKFIRIISGCLLTLESGIDVAAGIDVAPGINVALPPS